MTTTTTHGDPDDDQPEPIRLREGRGDDAEGETYVVRAVRPEDGPALVEMHNDIFVPQGEGVVPRTLEEWNWRFLDNPVGRIVSTVAVHATDGVVGAYHGLPVHMVVRGEDTFATQPVDLMVRRRHRPRGPRPSLFIALGRLWEDIWARGAPPRNLFNYGLPVPNWRSGSRWLKYENLRDYNLSFHEMPAGHRPAEPAGLEIRQVATDGGRFGADVDALYAAVRERPEGQTGIRKDAEWFNWRYLARPAVAYECFEVRDSGPGSALRAVGVYLRDDAMRPNTGFLVDWLVRADDHDALAAIVGEVERKGIRDATGVVATVMNPADPKFMPLQRMGYITIDMPYFVVIATYTKEIDILSLRREWCFAPGDFDLI